MRSILYILLFSTLYIGCKSPSQRLNILFDNVDGLAVGSEVKCKGLKIGEVVSLEILNRKVLAGIILLKNNRIPSDSKFFIRSSLLGLTSIEVEFSSNQTFLVSSDTVQGTFSRKSLLNEVITDSLKKKKIEKSLEKIATGIAEIIERDARDSLENK